MIGAIKSIFTNKPESFTYEDAEVARKTLTQLATELEATTTLLEENSAKKHASTIALAVRIRELLSHKNLALTHMEKIEITKALNRAKVRTFLTGTPEGFKTFRVLDTVSEDVRRHL